MVEPSGFYLWMWMITIGSGLAYVVSGEKQELMVEERRYNFQPVTKTKAFIKSEGFKSGLPDVVSNIGGLAILTQLDSVPSDEVIKTVGDALVPLIAAGLSLIPGGALIGGILTGVWGIMSALFGTPSKSPMEMAIDDIKNEIKELKEHVKKLGEQIKESVGEETDAKLSSIIHRAINGELTRNKYVCNKYSIISHDFIEDMRNNRIIDESRRIEITASIHDCDNFLRDTTDAFVYPEFAEVLWIPSVFTTLLRTSFLTEIINYGVSLKLDKPIISVFWDEYKSDIKRHFEFALTGIKRRLKTMKASKKVHELDVRYADFLPSEIGACKIQGQLLYIDREVYPYGVPEQFMISNSDTELKISDFNVTNEDEPHHIQIFPNEIDNVNDGNTEAIWNCIMGPMLTRLPSGKLSFPVTFVQNKSYQLRVLYFIKNTYHTCYSTGDKQDNTDSHLVVHQENNNHIRVSLAKGKPNENNPQRFLWRSGYHEMHCPLYDTPDSKYISDSCNPGCGSYLGSFVIENVATFNIFTKEQTKGRISIVLDGQLDIDIFGAEIIIHPHIL